MSSASATTLLPTAVALTAEDAINSIMSDIPLFCEGVMGIGVFTFFFLTKQVKLLLLFLYGSCLLAFAAATLDLSQILFRGPTHTTSQTASLASIDGFINAREVFLSLSLFALDLFFWYLVAYCPREECTRSRELSTSKSASGRSMHSASWNRWGVIGTILKYGSLTAVISVPILSIIWRLVSTQHSYSGTYVAESIIQTSIMAVFLLKLLLNVSISPVKPWWRALFSNAVPLTSLLFGITLGVGNLVSFEFTETTLGRFLLAIEVYLLIVHSLFDAFYDQKQCFALESSLPSNNAPLEKSQYIASELPFPHSSNNSKARDNKQTSTLSWIILPRSSGLQTDVTPRPQAAQDALWRKSTYDSRASFGSETLSRQPQRTERNIAVNISQANERPMTGVSLSYYAMGPSTPLSAEEDKYALSHTTEKEDRRKNTADSLRPSSTQAASIGSDQRSISSLDEIIRQQNELDETIVALRLGSMSIQQDVSNTSKKPASQSRSTSSKTASLSNRSDFSLSVFPDPPIILNDEVSTKYVVEDPGTTLKQRSRTRNVSSETNAKSTELPVDGTTAQLSDRVEFYTDSAPVYDVTSFIGDLSKPLRASQEMMTSAVIPDSEAGESLAVSTAQLGPLSGLRPMILASTTLVTQTSSPNAIASSPSQQQQYSDPRRSNNESPISLRPLLLGTPAVNTASLRLSTTKVPFAQRRQRGGTISSDTRRPVISTPRMNKDRLEGITAVFERPRPPPLILK